MLDYRTEVFKIRTNLGETTIPIRMRTKNNEITLPPRSETTKIFNFENKNPIIVKAQEILPGVMSTNAICIDGVA